MTGSTGSPADKVRILVVEDDPDQRAVMVEALRFLGNYTVDEAANGAVAVEKALMARPDIVIFDYFMPAANGARLVESLRMLVRPVPLLIAVSGVAQVQQWCVDHGIPVFLLKPFDVSSLQRAVEHAMHLLRQSGQRLSVPAMRAALRSACVLAVGPAADATRFRECLPEALRHARIVIAESVDEASGILEEIIPEVLLVDGTLEHQSMRLLADARGIPVIVR